MKQKHELQVKAATPAAAAPRARVPQWLVDTLRPVLAAVVGLVLGVSLTWFAGEKPWDVLLVIVKGAFGSPYNLGMTLFYTTPLVFTGLAVALPFRAGLFNIGGEGQLVMGALATTGAALALPATLPVGLAMALAAAAGFAAGALWGGIAGWLKAVRGSHEVITTIMLNFIAAGLASWVVLYLIRSVDTQNPESLKIRDELVAAPFGFFDSAPVSWALPFSLLVAVLVWLYLTHSVSGFATRATGANPEATAAAGTNVGRRQMAVMALAGGIAGLVGTAEILGNAGRFRLGFSPDFGFIGIPVALLARGNPLGVVLGALLFGALQKGTSELDLETMYVTRDLASLIQATVVLAVAAEGGLWFWRRRR